ncbi:hypothetical protein HZC53_02815 [Candidatus Uhrbacteria bacterium]|nr:hypothetical protein [Candidatus Uhrbacteria bacterium]
MSSFLFLLAPFMVQAVGISPVLIEAKGLLQNSSVSRKVYLTRSNPAEEEGGIVKVSGPAAQYIRLPNNGTLVLPKGMYNTAYEFFIEPGTLGAGEYTAKIQVAPTAAKGGAGGSGSAILTGAQADIRFTVTTEAVELFEIGNPVVRETEEGQILDFTYQLNNKGNVDTRPSKIELTISDEHDPKFSYAETIAGDTLKIVKALSTDSDDVPTKAQLAPGSYILKLKFYGKDTSKPVFESRDLRFHVYPKGTLAQTGELQTFVSDKKEYDGGELVGFKGAFKNTGSVGLTVTFDISIYQGDKRLEVLSTNPTFLGVGKTTNFEKTYRPPTAGDYRAVAVASFGATRSEGVEALFKVKPELPTTTVLPILAGGLVLLVIIILLLLRRRRKHAQAKMNQPKPPATPPTPPASTPPPAPPVTPTPPVAPPPAPPVPPAPPIPQPPAPPAPPVVPPQPPVVPPPPQVPPAAPTPPAPPAPPVAPPTPPAPPPAPPVAPAPPAPPAK